MTSSDMFEQDYSCPESFILDWEGIGNGIIIVVSEPFYEEKEDENWPCQNCLLHCCIISIFQFLCPETRFEYHEEERTNFKPAK